MKAWLPTGDLLTASGLALAALTVVFGLWSPQVNQALEIEKELDPRDRKPAILRLNEALDHKAKPLAIGSLIVVLILTPTTLAILGTSLTTILESSPKALPQYVPTYALSLAVWLLLLWLTYTACRQATALRKKLADFENN